MYKKPVLQFQTPTVYLIMKSVHTLLHVYQRPLSPESQVTRMPVQVALVIDDMGLDRERSKRAMELPVPLTLAFLPYADDLETQTKYCLEQRQGHELLVHVPMEPMDQTIDPGPEALLAAFSEDEVLAKLELNLRQFSGYSGVSNHMGSRFTSIPESMMWVMKALKSRRLYFLDTRTAQNSVAKTAAETAHVPFIERDVFLDHRDKEWALRKQLEKTLRIARKKGVAVAVCHPRETTLNVLESWLKTKEALRYQFITLSKIINK